MNGDPKRPRRGDWPAFPIDPPYAAPPHTAGMTLREYMATHIMAGLGAFSVYSDNTSQMGALALRLADELLAALAERGGP